MSKILLPYAEQFDEMNRHLSSIAGALSYDVDISTWEGIQKAVRVGVAPRLIPVGTQLVVNHSAYGEKLYDVVAHNYFKSAHDKYAPTMTLLSHDILFTAQFDAQEAFYYADTKLPAGTYNFTLPAAISPWEAGTYVFTLTKDIPVGGQLCITVVDTDGNEELRVFAYASNTTTNISEQCPLGKGNGGTSLGTLGVELNHSNRVFYGSNNYKESAIRQLLNSTSPSGSVWKPQTKFDRPPSWNTSRAGFAGGFDEDFLSIIGAVIAPCAANNAYESPDSTTMKGGKYTITDKFYLASQREIFGTSTGLISDDSVLFPYYDGATNADHIKYREGSVGGWWLRSSNSLYTHAPRVVIGEGSLENISAYRDVGIVPAFTIV